jgi:hypothetical protein
MSTEGASDMVILPVYIVSDSSAESNEFSAGRDRKEPASWNKGMQNRCQADTGLCAEYSRALVEGDKVIEASDGDNKVALV